MTKSIYLVIWVAVFLLISFTLGIVTQSQVDTWYLNLTKAPLNPPSILFPIVWTTLYIFLAYAGCTIFQVPQPFPSLIKWVYVIQMLLNWSWTPVFFTFHQTGPAFILLIAMVFLSLYLAISCRHHSKLLSVIFTVYLAWISFATYLSGYIWYFN